MFLQPSCENKNKTTSIIFNILKSRSKLSRDGLSVISVTDSILHQGISDAIFKCKLYSFFYDDKLEDAPNWGAVLEKRSSEQCDEIEKYYSNLKNELIAMGLIGNAILDANQIWFTLKGYKYYLDIERSKRNIEIFAAKRTAKSDCLKLILSKKQNESLKNDLLKIIYEYLVFSKNKKMRLKELVLRYLITMDKAISRYENLNCLYESNLYEVDSLQNIASKIKEMVLRLSRNNLLTFDSFCEHVGMTTLGKTYCEGQIDIVNISKKNKVPINPQKGKEPWFKIPWKLKWIAIAIAAIGLLIGVLKKQKAISVDGDVVGRDKIGVQQYYSSNSIPNEEKARVLIERSLEETRDWLKKEMIKIPLTRKRILEEDFYKSGHPDSVQGFMIAHQQEVLKDYVESLDIKLISMYKQIEDTILENNLSINYSTSSWIVTEKNDIRKQFQQSAENEIKNVQEFADAQFQKSGQSYSVRNAIRKALSLKYVEIK